MEPFTIHSLNNYTNVGLTSFAGAFELQPHAVRAMLFGGYLSVESQLEAGGIKYGSLKGALVPNNSRYEAAFMFDRTRIANDSYGLHVARQWIPALMQHGPVKTALSAGDLIGLSSDLISQQLDEHLVHSRPSYQAPSHHFYVVHMTNLSKHQLEKLDLSLSESLNAYVGYIGTTIWKPVMAGMLLPQVGLRAGEKVITEQIEGEGPNPAGYPFEEYGLRPMGVDDILYATYLDHRLDNGVPEWAAQDSGFGLTVLGGDQQPAATSELLIDDGRVRHLHEKHGHSLNRAQLDGLDREVLAAEIQGKIARGLVYDLRFRLGTRNGKLAPENDAMMYSVQVEFPKSDGTIRRYQVGLKYRADLHTSEITTFY
ncbi:hypothetical protein [Brachybacterium paraconglomeratum]|uniref:hypothetical protein n=1 Tax=Brachybacterium paraconglomeratum TaxID=173362 RepID=UPI0022AF89AD|nr:hypothetical protein [Brachybacterium paraconglomeratum]MCZ4328124.1 hypothetical protein [Brachybacterium paraconglomeratum]